MRRWAADLGLVADAPEADAHEVAPRGPCDRLAEGRLADARRARETEDRTLHLADEGLDGEVLEDALLRLLEAEVVFVEDLLRRVDVLVLLRALEPRERDHPVDVVADDGRLRTHRRHHLELAELFVGSLARMLGHLLRRELFLELLHLVLELVALAELLLDRPHLLVEVVLLLGLLHLLLDAAADALLDFEHLDLGLEQSEHLFEPLGRIDDLEESLPVLELQVQMGGHRVGEAPGRLELGHGVQDLGRDLLVELDVVLERRVKAPDQCLRLRRLDVVLLDDVDVDREVRLALRELDDLDARLALDEHLDGLVGQAEELDDRAERPEPEDVLFARLLGRVVALGGQDEFASSRDRLFERP